MKSASKVYAFGALFVWNFARSRVDLVLTGLNFALAWGCVQRIERRWSDVEWFRFSGSYRRQGLCVGAAFNQGKRHTLRDFRKQKSRRTVWLNRAVLFYLCNKINELSSGCENARQGRRIWRAHSKWLVLRREWPTWQAKWEEENFGLNIFSK